MNLLNDLYQDVILDHSKHPRNFGQPDDANHEAHGNNPLCGDQVTIYLRIEDDVVESAHFEAKGCAISVASASIMTKMITGKTTTEVRDLFDKFHSMVTEGKEHNDDINEINAFAGVHEFPMRIKCATMSWHAMIAAIETES